MVNICHCKGFSCEKNQNKTHTPSMTAYGIHRPGVSDNKVFKSCSRETFLASCHEQVFELSNGHKQETNPHSVDFT